MTYFIIAAADLTQALVDACLQTNLASVRKSVDGTQAVLKFKSPRPAEVAAVNRLEYTHAAILAEMAKPEWTPDPGA